MLNPWGRCILLRHFERQFYIFENRVFTNSQIFNNEKTCTDLYRPFIRPIQSVYPLFVITGLLLSASNVIKIMKLDVSTGYIDIRDVLLFEAPESDVSNLQLQNYRNLSTA